jgi:ABC-type polysaccharide/polyol phosphate export permease
MALSRFKSILVVAGVLFALASMVGVSYAAGSKPAGPPVVRAKKLNRPPAGPVVHAASIHRAPAVAAGTLPFTGADVILFLGVGMLTFAAGLTLVRKSRPRSLS